MPLSKFCPISGDWNELGIPNLVWMSLIKSYWLLQNARVTAFTVSELFRENQQSGQGFPYWRGWGGSPTQSPPSSWKFAHPPPPARKSPPPSPVDSPTPRSHPPLIFCPPPPPPPPPCSSPKIHSPTLSIINQMQIMM